MFDGCENFINTMWNESEKFINNILNDSEDCRSVTVENPMGNPSLADMNTSKADLPVCQDKVTHDFQDKILNNGIFMDSNDYVWRRNSESKLIFNTVNGNTIPNDQSSFANWCYNDKNNCKNGSIYFKDPDLADVTNCRPSSGNQLYSKTPVSFF
jgi:hypothetical protein